MYSHLKERQAADAAKEAADRLNAKSTKGSISILDRNRPKPVEAADLIDVCLCVELLPSVHKRTKFKKKKNISDKEVLDDEASVVSESTNATTGTQDDEQDDDDEVMGRHVKIFTPHRAVSAGAVTSSLTYELASTQCLTDKNFKGGYVPKRGWSSITVSESHTVIVHVLTFHEQLVFDERPGHHDDPPEIVITRRPLCAYEVPLLVLLGDQPTFFAAPSASDSISSPHHHHHHHHHKQLALGMKGVLVTSDIKAAGTTTATIYFHKHVNAGSSKQIK